MSLAQAAPRLIFYGSQDAAAVLPVTKVVIAGFSSSGPFGPCASAQSSEVSRKGSDCTIRDCPTAHAAGIPRSSCIGSPNTHCPLEVVRTAHHGASRAATGCALQEIEIATAASAKTVARIMTASFFFRRCADKHRTGIVIQGIMSGL